MDAKTENTGRCLGGNGDRCLETASNAPQGLTIADLERPFDPKTSPHAKDAQSFVDAIELAPYNKDGAKDALVSMKEKLGGMSELDRLDLLKGVDHFKKKNPISPFALEVSLSSASDKTMKIADVDVTTKDLHADLLDTPQGAALDKLQTLLAKGFQSIGTAAFETAAKDPSMADKAFDLVLEMGDKGQPSGLPEMLRKSPELAQRINDNFSKSFAGTELEGLSKQLLDVLAERPATAVELNELVKEANTLLSWDGDGKEQLKSGTFKALGDFALSAEQKSSRAAAENKVGQHNSASKKQYDQLKDLLWSR